MGFLFFGKKLNGPKLVAQARQSLEALKEQRKALEELRQEKLHRQVELWSILDLPPDLEAEYKEVSTLIAKLIKQVAALDETIKKMQLPIYHCEQQEECQELSALMEEMAAQQKQLAS